LLDFILLSLREEIFMQRTTGIRPVCSSNGGRLRKNRYNISKCICSFQLIVLISLINAVFITTGCARDGKFSKEGAYEILRGRNKTQDITIDDEPREDETYHEYERRRQSVLKEEDKK
jgi:hypothetical protein